MMPTLHNWENINSYGTLGIGALSDAISCTVTEVRNGEFDLVMQYPSTGIRFDEIKVGRIIMAPHDATRKIKPFSVYRIEKNINGVCTVYAHHISYDLNYVLTRTWSTRVLGLSNYLSRIQMEAYGGRRGRGSTRSNYYLFTDITDSKEHWLDKPSVVRNLVLDLAKEYDAEIVWGPIEDDYHPSFNNASHYYTWILSSRGKDSGATIRYGGNLTSAEKSVDVDSSYGVVWPYWHNSDTNTYTYYTPGYREPYVPVEGGDAYLFNRKFLDLTPDFDTAPTSSEESAYTSDFLTRERPFEPLESFTINFSPYIDVDYDYDADVLRGVCLCDWVNLEVDGLDVSKKLKVVKTVYNVLMDRYDSLTLDTIEKSFAETVQDGVAAAADSGSDSGGGGTSTDINWVDLTVESGVTNPSTNVGNARKLQIGKMGKRVYIRGTVDVAGASSGNKVIANLPSEYVPAYPAYFWGVYQGAHIAKMFINASGEFGITAVYNISDAARYTTKDWLDCSFSYWLD